MGDARYNEYINSNEWKQKRLQRLAISKFRCAACGSRQSLEVHHLTYDRLFNEDMADLLPLCYLHHMAAEELIGKGELARTGNPLFLASETIRLISPRSGKKHRKQVEGVEVRNRSQESLLNDQWFLSALAMPRKSFKRMLRERFNGMPNHSRLMANACVLYDRQTRKLRQERRLLSSTLNP